MIANSTIEKKDKIFKCEVTISEKYGPPVIEVEYGMYIAIFSFLIYLLLYPSFISFR